VRSSSSLHRVRLFARSIRVASKSHTSTRQEETKKLRLLGTLRKLERLKQAL